MMSIPEAGAHFLGWRYAKESSDNRVPVIQGCLPSGLALGGDARVIDCSTFVVAVLCYAYAGRMEWDRDAYADMQIMDAGRLWSCVDAWSRHGLGDVVEGPAQGWGVYQGWVDDQPSESDGDGISGGHQWLFHLGMGVRLHSSSVGGVGPKWERVDWAELVARYRSGIRGVGLTGLP